jgi:hypothetical protein
VTYDDFKDAPESITEIRANKADKASLWTPRDALISALREIDQGNFKPFVAFIALGSASEDGTTNTRFFVAGQNTYEIHGVAMRALYMIDSHE